MEQQEQFKSLIETLKRVLKSSSIRKPRGRPKRIMKTEEIVFPSKIKKKYRTFASKVIKYSDPRLYPIIEEYKRKLYDLATKKYAGRKALQRVGDIVSFRFRKPTKRERELIGDDILPSDIFGQKLPAEVDIDLYNHEYKQNLDIDKYTWRSKKDEPGSFITDLPRALKVFMLLHPFCEIFPRKIYRETRI